MNRLKKILALMPMLALFHAAAVSAGSEEYVSTPIVEEGEKEIDFKFGTQKSGDTNHVSAATIGFGYGVNSWWFTELYGKYKRQSPDGTKFDAWEWENKFQLTETGKYFADFGVLIEVERPQDRTEGYEARFGPLMQTEIGKFQINANLLWGRHYRAVSNGPTELGYQAQIKYPVQPQFEIGLQAFGNLGPWKHWSDHDQQEHKIGPAIFGKVKVGEHQVIKYNAAWLFGTTAATSDNTFRTQIEFEF